MADARKDLQDVAFRESTLVSKYDRSLGLLVIPVMGPVGTPPVVVRVHAPVGMRTADFAYTKTGTPPVIPAPVDTPSGDTILSSSLNIVVARITPDDQNRMLYSISGSYLYVQPDGGRGETSQFPIDKHPFFTPLDEFITPSPGRAGEDMVRYVRDTNSLRSAGSEGIPFSAIASNALNAVWVANVLDLTYLSSSDIIA